MTSTVGWRNWAGTVHSRPSQIAHPSSEEELAQALAGGDGPVKVAGAGHSCAPIASAPAGGRLIVLDNYNCVEAFEDGYVTVQAGVTLKALNDFLRFNGYALPNLGSIAEQTVAGAISTGTHGSGITAPALDQQVTRIVLFDAAGRRHALHGGDDLFDAARVSLGALGVISTVTLRCVPAFRLRAFARRSRLDETLEQLDTLKQRDRFRFWWFPHTPNVQLWWTEPGGARPAPPKGDKLFESGLWLASVAPKWTKLLNKAAERWLVGGDADFGGQSDRVLTFPIRIRQHVMEWGIPAEAAVPALRALKRLSRKHWMQPPVEVRFAPANDAWLSMAHGRTTCYIGVIAYRPFGQPARFEPYFKDVDALMAGFDGRPHWAKEHYRDAADLSTRYEMWESFQKYRAELDPAGVFTNAYLRRVLGQ